MSSILFLPENIMIINDISIKICKKYNIPYKEVILLQKIHDKCKLYMNETDLIRTNKKIVTEIIDELKSEDKRDQFISIHRSEKFIPDRHIDLSKSSSLLTEEVETKKITPRELFKYT